MGNFRIRGPQYYCPFRISIYLLNVHTTRTHGKHKYKHVWFFNSDVLPNAHRLSTPEIIWDSLGGTVYPKKYVHGFYFAVLCCGCTLTDFPISIRLTSLALWQSNDCPSARKATLMNMDKYFMWIHYERLHNHNKIKHNKTVCIFLRIYCNDSGMEDYKGKWRALLTICCETHNIKGTLFRGGTLEHHFISTCMCFKQLW